MKQCIGLLAVLWTTTAYAQLNETAVPTIPDDPIDIGTPIADPSEFGVPVSPSDAPSIPDAVTPDTSIPAAENEATNAKTLERYRELLRVQRAVNEDWASRYVAAMRQLEDRLRHPPAELVLPQQPKKAEPTEPIGRHQTGPYSFESVRDQLAAIVAGMDDVLGLRSTSR